MVLDDYLKYALFAVGVVWLLSNFLGGSGSGASANAHHILVKDRAKCDELKAALDAVPQEKKLYAFQQLAQKESTCPSGKSGGSLGTFSPGQMVPAFDKVIFGAEAGAVGAVLGPVETQFGCHLILIISRDDGEKKDGEKDGEKKD